MYGLKGLFQAPFYFSISTQSPVSRIYGQSQIVTGVRADIKTLQREVYIMGNWINNTIDAKGIGNLDIFTNQILDFRKIVPEPPASLSKPPKDKPWFDWYKWRCDFWGTHCDVDMEPDDFGIDHIVFDTKNCPPHPIIARISKMLGNVPLTLVSVDIDNLYSPLYKTVWMNGVMTQAYCAQFEYNLDPNAEDDGEYGEFYAIETNPRWDITE